MKADMTKITVLRPFSVHTRANMEVIQNITGILAHSSAVEVDIINKNSPR
jgi:hypothetical protein